MKLVIYQAECGDAARVEFKGSNNKLHHILIDTGFERTYRHVLHNDLLSLKSAGEMIDLCVISHIHDDHIGGAIAYIKARQTGSVPELINSWMYNPPRGRRKNEENNNRIVISSAKSIVQGDMLASYLIENNKFSDTDFTNESPVQDLFGMKITVLSPNKLGLKALREKYPEGKRKPFEREENDEVSQAKSRLKNDYNIPLKDFDIYSAAEDDSVENGSSIAVLLEHEGVKFLNLADAHPSVVANSLKQAGYSPEKPLVCDWVKIAHHGSKGNNLSQLYDLIRCENFVVSSNGDNKHKLPSKKCLATIVRNQYRTTENIRFYLTYDNTTLRNIFASDSHTVFEEFNFSIHLSNLPSQTFTT